MVKDLMSQSYSAMRYNRRRTALTMLGMAWGIATVVLLLAYGAGFGRAIQAIFESWGTRIIGVFPGRTSQQAGGQKAGTKIKFTIDDLNRITTAAPLVNHISPEVDKQSNVPPLLRSLIDRPTRRLVANCRRALTRCDGICLTAARSTAGPGTAAG